jgi:hypothetical protein
MTNTPMTNASTDGILNASPIFETFVRDPGELMPGREGPLVLRDLRPGRRKYLAQNVIARVWIGSSCPRDAVPLRVRTAVGNQVPGPWWVQIVAALPARLPGAPYSSALDALSAAHAAASLAQDRKAKLSS